MDEFEKEVIEVQGVFDFRNWASFILFSYLMLLLIFGVVQTQNMDQQDIAKMNDMDIDDNAQYSTALESQNVQFPLSAFALKR